MQKKEEGLILVIIDELEGARHRSIGAAVSPARNMFSIPLGHGYPVTGIELDR